MCPELQTNGVFEMHIKNSGGKELVYTIDLKKVRLRRSQEIETIQLTVMNLPERRCLRRTRQAGNKGRCHHQHIRWHFCRRKCNLWDAIDLHTNIFYSFWKMADGKLNGQKAFMSGKLKVKGNIMLATSEFRIVDKKAYRAFIDYKFQSSTVCSRPKRQRCNAL